MNRPPIITLTSDFGWGPFVGVMKGVILSICPQARLVDLDHSIPPQEVLAGALSLAMALDVFPPGAVHLAVVDPGVGTQRRGLVIEAKGMLWVGPDNGLFTAVLRSDPTWRAHELVNRGFFRAEVSQTFHGRDVFAPAAAHLAAGAAPAEMGPPVSDPIQLDWPEPRSEGGCLKGQVLGVDRFGNLITNLDRDTLEGFLAGREAVVRIGGLEVRGLSRAYGQAAPGEVLALINSMNFLELAINQGDLCRRMGWQPAEACGQEVMMSPLS